jgi:hypothetical protein
MIKHSTLFITGAGASIPYGMPSGTNLVHYIIKSLEPDYKFQYKKFSLGDVPENEEYITIEQQWNDYDLYRKLNFDEGIINNFRTALSNSGLYSIDAFLERSIKFIEIGKTAIANVLLKFENKERLKGNDRNWIKYLWNNMNPTYDDFDANEISFITFNYDRVIEYCLALYSSNSFGKGDAKWLNKLDKIPVIHIHGKLGIVPWAKIVTEAPVEFGFDPNNFEDHFKKVQKARQYLKIINENPKDDQDIIISKELIKNAKAIIFLGFGYHENNMAKLDIMKISGKQLIGTGYGLTNLEISNLKTLYNMYIIDNEHGDNLDFLRNNVILK